MEREKRAMNNKRGHAHPRTANPLHRILNCIPQLAISTATVLFFVYHASTAIRPSSGFIFSISTLALFILCSTFIYLQVIHASYRNWQQDRRTRQTIQIATIASIVTCIGYPICYWHIFKWFTPIVLIASCVWLFTVLQILTAFV
ncbi:uncharacterized protein BYT42DRAFT_589601 [Radiomyces spectabilis]|uniref:uncharacterized protein n=1 Tax=Radiomyces spectabilis TaxID=64574 RepID=UPI00221F0C2A|nr:uncharacterized protein BYT42DRAFT_589601 [Radiomyces spectabilis]KAI8365342.1 hypothetical protein BYT42DRAFT_589601 [Radiomyces spectabilis]